MANQYLTVQQAQYLLEKWKAEAASEYVAKAGDTMTGKLNLDAGMAIKYPAGSGQTNPPYYVCLKDQDETGAWNFGFVTRANMLSAIGGIGAFFGSVTPSSVNVTSATDTTLCNTGSLSSGLYVVLGTGNFASNASGRRHLFLSSSNGSADDRFCQVWMNATSGAATKIQLIDIIQVSSSATYYLRAYQNSGSTLSVQGGIRYLKLA